jgi:hypothetical protein
MKNMNRVLLISISLLLSTSAVALADDQNPTPGQNAIPNCASVATGQQGAGQAAVGAPAGNVGNQNAGAALQ